MFIYITNCMTFLMKNLKPVVKNCQKYHDYLTISVNAAFQKARFGMLFAGVPIALNKVVSSIMITSGNFSDFISRPASERPTHESVKITPRGNFLHLTQSASSYSCHSVSAADFRS